MSKIEETALPGVGIRHQFTSEDGTRIGVIHHRTGRRELFFCEQADPDSVSHSLDLSDDDSHALSEALGAPTVVARLTSLQQQIEGLAIDWLRVAEETPYSGKSIGDARIRTRTGVSVVAVIRRDQAFPAPGPGFLIEHDDTLVVVGTPEGIKAVSEILTVG